MTLLNLQGAEIDLGLPRPIISGSILLEYVVGDTGFVEVDGDTVILPRPIQVKIVAGVPTVDVELVPTRDVCCLHIAIASDGASTERWVAVPDVPSIDYGDLVDVDPSTFESLVPLPPSAQQILTTAQTAVDDALESADVASGFADEAETQSLLAEGFAGDAATSATEAQEAADSVIPTTSAAVAAAITVDGPAKTTLNATIAVGAGSMAFADWVPFGDSHTAAMGSQNPSDAPAISRDSYHFWARYILDGRLRMVANAGINGNTSAQGVARLDADVISRLPNGGICTVQFGTNDVLNGVAIATYKANIAEIVERLLEARIIPILLTIPPIGLGTGSTPTYLNPSSTNRTTAQLLMQSQINDWLLIFGRSVGARVEDISTVITQEANAAYLTNYTADGVHGLPVAQFAQGVKLAAALSPYVPPAVAHGPGSNIDPTNLMPNGLLLDNNDVLPTGWSLQTANPITTVVGPVSGFRGEAVTVTGWSRASANSLLGPLLSGFAFGDRLAISYKYRAFGTQAKGLRPAVRVRSNGGSFLVFAEQWTEADSPEPHTVYMEKTILQNPTTQIRFSIEPGNVGQSDPTTAEGITIGEIAIRKLV